MGLEHRLRRQDNTYQERIFSLAASVGFIVGAVACYPGGLVGDGPDSCAAELDELILVLVGL